MLIERRNHPENLDPALRRPGRFDISISFDIATHTQIKLLFEHFYPNSTVPADIQICDKDILADNHLVTEFANAFVPEIQAEESFQVKGVSMAAVQGYLLG